MNRNSVIRFSIISSIVTVASVIVLLTTEGLRNEALPRTTEPRIGQVVDQDLIATIFSQAGYSRPNKSSNALPKQNSQSAQVSQATINAAPASKVATNPLGPDGPMDNSWFETAKQEVRAREYWVSDNGTGLQAPNRTQNIRTYFSEDGVKFEDRVDSNGTLAELTYAGLSRNEDLGAIGTVGQSVSHDQNRISISHSDGVEEWYVNRYSGIEHGFEIPNSPDGDGRLNLFIDVGASDPYLLGGEVLLTQGEGRTLRYKDLYVIDALGTTLESSMTVNTNKQIVLSIDDHKAQYPLTVDPVIVGVFDVFLQGTQKYGFFGISIASAGDLNGDGFDDVMVGSDFYDGGQVDEGAVFIYLGSATGLPTTPSIQLEADNVGAQFGNSVAPAGDVNNDGYDDIVVGAWELSATEIDQGAAFVYYGSPTGPNAIADWGILGNSAGDLMGKAVAGAGDINGDGFDDVVIGVPGLNIEEEFVVETETGDIRIVTDTITNGGAVLLFYGSGNGLPLTQSWSVVGDEEFDQFGWVVSSAGDVNADGFDELLFSTPIYGEDDAGKAFMHFGSALGLSNNNNWRVSGSAADSNLGISAIGLGDVNDDGFDDVGVGVTRNTDGTPAILIYHGKSRGPDESPSAQLRMADTQGGLVGNTGFGSVIADVGDINGDHYDDLVVGAPRYPGFFDPADPNGGLEEGGAIFVYLGSRDGLNSSVSQTVFGTEAEAQFGVSAAGIGDVNGDGFGDFMVGADLFDNGPIYGISGLPSPGPGDPVLDGGAVFVFYGSAFGVNPSAARRLDFGFDFDTMSVHSAGDLNSDGYGEVVVADSNYDAGAGNGGGAIFVYLGADNGVLTSPNIFISRLDEAYGVSIAELGDIDQDGFDDLAVGASRYSNGEVDEGAVYVYRGHPDDIMTTNAPTVLESNIAGLFFGVQIDAAGSRNGDVYQDLVVGAPGYSVSQAEEGAVYYFFGQNGGINTVPQINPGGTAFYKYGWQVAGVGDINGDGYDDVAAVANSSALIGLPNNINWEVFFDISPAPDSFSILTNSLQVGDVEGIGDANGDGYDDVAYSDTDVVYVHYGDPILPLRTSDFLFSNQFGSGFGNAIEAAGDINNDGFDDLLIGAPLFSRNFPGEGAVFAYYGSAFGARFSPAWQAEGGDPQALFGSSIAVTSKNPAQNREVVIAAPGIERAYAFKIDGTAISNYVDDDGDGAPDQLEEAAGLDRNDPYDGYYDTDSDGLRDGLELAIGTDLNNPDSDGDGIADGVEYALRQYGFPGVDPLAINADTDGDGLSDVFESVFGLDPADADTDNDGMPDGYEMLQTIRGFDGEFIFDPAVGYLFILDPFFDDGGFDFDGDGATNLEEYLGDSDPLDPTSLPVSNDLNAETIMVGLEDINVSGASEIALLVVNGGNEIQIRDSVDDTLIRTIVLDADPVAAMEVLEDINGNGAQEIAIAATLADGNVRVQIRDSVTGNVIRNVFYGSAYNIMKMKIVADYDLNGTPEIAVMGSNNTDAIRIQVRDSGDGSFLDNIFLGTMGVGQDFLTVADLSGNSVPEVAILSVLKSNNQIRTQLWDASAATFQGDVWFGSVYQPFRLIKIPDSNGNGSEEIVALGIEPGTELIRVQVRDSDTAATLTNIFLGATNKAVDMVMVNDINGNGSPDLAILLETPTGKGRVRIEDSSTGAFIRNLFSGVDEPTSLTVLPDYDGNGFEELAILGQIGNARSVIVLDTNTASQINRVDFP